jgi:flagellin-like protein
MKLKGISPMIAVILLIAFTVAIGGILSVWLTGLQQQQTTVTGEYAEKVAKCAGVSLNIKNITPILNNQITFQVSHESGTYELTNVQVVVVYTDGGSTTQNCNPTTLYSGSICVATINTEGKTILKARATGLCLGEIPKIKEWQ